MDIFHQVTINTQNTKEDKVMYVRTYTTKEEIVSKIRSIEEELNENKYLDKYDRMALHDELDYLYSFINGGSY